MAPRIFIVDVFAEQPYAGNQLAVVMGGDSLSDETMHRIALETNYSETTFVSSQPEDDGGYPVRIFTPSREISFAGHPILGTAWALRQFVQKDHSSQVKLNLKVGQVTVTFVSAEDGNEILWFRAPPVTLGPMPEPQRVAKALGLSRQDLATVAPPQMVSGGISAIIVPLNSLDALRRSQLDLEAFSPLAESGYSPLVYAFTRETREAANDLSVRFFFEAHGVREDPATGNGAAFLGAYLLEHSLFPDSELSLRIEQGHEVRRPSLILLRARMSDGEPEINVGGHVIPTVEGHLV